MADPAEPLRAPPRTRMLVAISLVGAAVEFTWASGEAVIEPFLLQFWPASTASFVFLANPAVSLWLQPLLGQASDRCTSRFGRRRPFIVGLTVTGILGLAMVSMLGRLGALLVGALPTLPASALGQDPQLRTLMLASAILLFGAATACVLSAKEAPRPKLYRDDPWTTSSRDECLLPAPSEADVSLSRVIPMGGIQTSASAGRTAPGTRAPSCVRGVSRAVWLLLSMQVHCWIGLMCWCFYCTTWLPLDARLAHSSLHVALVTPSRHSSLCSRGGHAGARLRS